MLHLSFEGSCEEPHTWNNTDEDAVVLYFVIFFFLEPVYFALQFCSILCWTFIHYTPGFNAGCGGAQIELNFSSFHYSLLSWPALKMLDVLQTQMLGLSLVALLQRHQPPFAHDCQLPALFSYFVKHFRFPASRRI